MKHLKCAAYIIRHNMTIIVTNNSPFARLIWNTGKAA